MKKELLKIKIKRLTWAVLFGSIFLGVSVVPTFIIFEVWVRDVIGSDISTTLLELITIGLMIKVLKRPTDWIDKVFFRPRLDDYDSQVRIVTERILNLRLQKLEDRDKITTAKMDISEELKRLPYTLESSRLIREVSARLNDIHADEPKNKNVIDITDVELTKKSFKRLKKEVVANTKKVRVSRLNVYKLQDIEEILTGKLAKEEAERQAEHQRQLEIANAGAAKTVIQNEVSDVNKKALTYDNTPLLIDNKET